MDKTFLAVMLAVSSAGALAESTTLKGDHTHDLTLTKDDTPVVPGVFALLAGADGTLSGVLNYWQTATGHQVDLYDAAGSFVRTVAADGSSGFPAFVAVRDGEVYLGRADWTDPTQDGIERVVGGLAAENGTVERVMDLQSVYDLAIAPGGEAYAVFNDGTNRIARVDLDAGTAETVLDVGGFSTGLACDSEGGLVFGTYAAYGAGSDRILRCSPGLLAGPLPLSLDDAEVLAEMPPGAGAGGVAVDDADNVLFAMNDGGHYLGAVYAGKDYAGEPRGYDILAAGRTWLTQVETLGDVTRYDGVSPGNAAFTVGYFHPISYAPEPGALALLAAGGLALLRRRRRGG
jgi:hypothetical protein